VSQRDSRPAIVAIFIVFLPVVLTFFYVFRLSVEMPWFDDWDIFVPPFYHQAAGNLHWSDINEQHNESLVMFPVAASLILAKITHGQMLAIIYLSYLFLSGSLVSLFLFFRMLRLPGRWSVLWFLPVSLLCLGWRQSEGLLWSTHLVNSMALFFTLASFYSCTRAVGGRVFLAAAIVCAWIASFSMASGLLAWIPGAIALGFAGRERLRFLIWWLLSAAVCIVCFLVDRAAYEVPWGTGIWYVVANSADAAKYALTYLGGSLAKTPSQALAMGIIVVVLAIPVLFLALRTTRADRFPPGLLLAVYTGVVVVALLDRRLGVGVEHAFDSRYVTLSTLMPIGLYFCSLELMKTRRSGRYLTGASIALMAFGIVHSYSAGLADGRDQRDFLTECAAAVKDFRQVDPERLECAYPKPTVVLERAPGLEQYRLSLFLR
jgi:hypothetical protein